jgi:hypothetical protein
LLSLSLSVFVSISHTLEFSIGFLKWDWVGITVFKVEKFIWTFSQQHIIEKREREKLCFLSFNFFSWKKAGGYRSKLSTLNVEELNGRYFKWAEKILSRED